MHTELTNSPHYYGVYGKLVRTGDGSDRCEDNVNFLEDGK